jgi:hypothetical protein
MTNLILIDLSKLVKTHNELYRITNYYRSIGVPIPTSKEATPIYVEGESYETILWFMRTKQVIKIWVNPDNGFIIAYEDNKGYSFSENFTNHLTSIEPIDINEDILNQSVDIDTDSILDKISKYGIASLTKEEKDFLDSQN